MSIVRGRGSSRGNGQYPPVSVTVKTIARVDPVARVIAVDVDELSLEVICARVSESH